jgi:hypothetical protein
MFVLSFCFTALSVARFDLVSGGQIVFHFSFGSLVKSRAIPEERG